MCASGADVYAWSPSGQTTTCITVNGNGGKKYFVTGTDTVSGCSALDSITVTPIPLPNCNISGKGNICYGQSTTLCAAQGAGYSYAWSTGETTSCITVSGAATYSVTVSNAANGCSSTCKQPVIVNPLPSCSISISTCQLNHQHWCMYTLNHTHCNGPNFGTLNHQHCPVQPESYALLLFNFNM